MSIVNVLENTSSAGRGATAATRSVAQEGEFRTAFQNATERNKSAMGGGVAGSSDAAPSSVEQEFMDYASMSLEEKMFYAALASLGISKKDYDAMSAAERLEIAAKVSLMMQQLTKAKNTEHVL